MFIVDLSSGFLAAFQTCVLSFGEDRKGSVVSTVVRLMLSRLLHSMLAAMVLLTLVLVRVIIGRKSWKGV